MWYFWIFVGLTLGIILDVVITVCHRNSGLLRLHYGDEDEQPYLFLELNDEPEKLVNKKHVIFRVKVDSRE